MPTPANDPRFEPQAMADPDFNAWALRVGLRLRNLPAGATVRAFWRAIAMDGTPSPEWAQALIFMLTSAQACKRNPAKV